MRSSQTKSHLEVVCVVAARKGSYYSKPDGEHVMSITPYLGNEYFEPDIIANMSTAFANGCRALELYYHGDAAADLVAMKVIELARAGERDVDALTTKILEIFSTREF